MFSRRRKFFAKNLLSASAGRGRKASRKHLPHRISKMKIFYFLNFLLAVTMGAAGFCLAADNLPAADKSYRLGLSYQDGVLNPKEIVLENSAPADHRIWPNIGWACKIADIDGKILGSFKFSLPLAVCRDADLAEGATSTGCAAGSTADFNLNIPYYERGAALAFYDQNGNFAFLVDTVKFAQLCGDGICESNENYSVCGQDCRSGVKDGVCDKVKDGVCDADCVAGQDFDCSEQIMAIGLLLAALALVSAAAVFGFVFWRKKAKRDEDREFFGKIHG
jgi:hypothetical protein